jgi:hypothetical protein
MHSNAIGPSMQTSCKRHCPVGAGPRSVQLCAARHAVGLVPEPVTVSCSGRVDLDGSRIHGRSSPLPALGRRDALAVAASVAAFLGSSSPVQAAKMVSSARLCQRRHVSCKPLFSLAADRAEGWNERASLRAWHVPQHCVAARVSPLPVDHGLQKRGRQVYWLLFGPARPDHGHI